MNSSPYLTHMGLVGMAALWGASWPWGRVVAQAMPALTAACLRFIWTSVVLLLWLYRSRGLGSLRALHSRQWIGLTCASTVGVLGYSIFFLLALKSVPAGKAAMVVALNPVLIMLFTVLLFREKVNKPIVVGLILAVTGALYALSGGSMAVLQPGQSGAGELLLLGCAGCWVAYTLIGRMALATVDSLTTTAVTATIGAVLLLIASLVLEGPAARVKLPNAPSSA
nr:DMT family transporter [Ottowia thiooxydans]